MDRKRRVWGPAQNSHATVRFQDRIGIAIGQGSSVKILYSRNRQGGPATREWSSSSTSRKRFYTCATMSAANSSTASGGSATRRINTRGCSGSSPAAEILRRQARRGRPAAVAQPDPVFNQWRIHQIAADPARIEAVWQRMSRASSKIRTGASCKFYVALDDFFVHNIRSLRFDGTHFLQGAGIVIYWHSLLGLALTDFFTGSPWNR